VIRIKFSSSNENLLAPCYHGQVGDSDSVFTVESQRGKQVSGSMAFIFAQKDSSHGTYRGTYEKNLLKVAYTFWSEGVQSVGDLEFNKVGANFKGSGYTYLPASDCQTFLKK
jgi:hypothetical protein